ncbi:MAG: hypothetical protein EB007_06305 [Betaproteobacteria bacterium]|nr:hypothetical protein [Betaproteobacteria bacterium]
MSVSRKKLLAHLSQEVFCHLGVSPVHGIGVFAIRAENEDGLAGLAAEFAIVFMDGSQLKVGSDAKGDFVQVPDTAPDADASVVRVITGPR